MATFAFDAVKVLTIIYVVSRIVKTLYDIYFHPLNKVPGPKIWIAFPILRQAASVRGSFDRYMCDFHRKYGIVVRFSPNEISFINEDAWRDIYDHKPLQLERFILSCTRRPDIFDSTQVDHERHRKALAHSFSPKGLREQEPIVKSYIDTMINSLRTEAHNGAKVGLVKWYTLVLFDIIGDLAFGQSFNGLRDRTVHFTISFTFEAYKLLTFLEAGASYPILLRLLTLFTSKAIIDARYRKEKHAEEAVKRRLADKSLDGRGDFMDSMLKDRNKAQGLSDQELIANASTLITAGSETTSTILSGLTFLLLQHPRVYQRVVQEVRSAYMVESDISMTNTAQRLPYMSACFLEAFRLYPPVPSSLHRVTPANTAHLLFQVRVTVGQLFSSHCIKGPFVIVIHELEIADAMYLF